MDANNLNSVRRDAQKKQAAWAVQYVREQVHTFEGGNVSTFAYLSGQVSVLLMVGLIDHTESELLHAMLDNRQYGD